ncbi:hypothetical protein MHYP_G00355850 [Metynnis hypsauchen]
MTLMRSLANFLDEEGLKVRSKEDMIKEIKALHSNCQGWNPLVNPCKHLAVHICYDQKNIEDLKMNTTLTNSSSLDFLPIVITSIHVVNFFLSLSLNIYVIVLLFPCRGVMEASDVFSWNQAISDICFVLLGPFHSLCTISKNLCIFVALDFFFGVSLCSRCVFQSCTCLERYLAVVHPVTFLRYKPLRYRVACSITAWMFSLAIGVTCSCIDRDVYYTVFCYIFIIVLTVDIFCCVSILRKLRHPGPRDMGSDVGEMNAVKKKAFQVVSVNLLAFTFQTIPLCVAFVIQYNVPQNVFAGVAVTSLAVNIVTGLLQPVYVLHRAGKLPSIQSTPFSTCCIRSG